VRVALAVCLGLVAFRPAAAQDPSSRAGFRFSAEAGAALRALWDESVAANQERVACLAADVRGDSVFVSRILPIEPDAADSLGISATASLERCGPPEWDGTVHTHVALYTDEGPSRRFSGQDRTVMRMWYDRWRADGVFCVVHSERDAHCEADGVVGGVRSLAGARRTVVLASPGDETDGEIGGDNRPFWTGHPDAATFERSIDGRLARARRLLDGLTAVTGRRTVANTLAPYDRLMRELDRASSEAGLIRSVHPDSVHRQAGERSDQRVSALATEISLDRRVFDAISAMDLAGADSVTRHYVRRILRDFRLAGVDRDSATRARVRALRDELVLIGQEFDRNILDDVRTIEVASPLDLEGLPQDFIAAHPPGADGRIRLTTDYPDVTPVLTYARSDDLRRRVRAAFDNRAYPRNMAVLDRLIARRHEVARLLGFASWADHALADKMAGSAANASAFIDRVVAASKVAAERDYRMLLRRKRQDHPAARAIDRWETGYLKEQVRRSEYDFDSQQVRPYFPYDRVKQGILDLSASLFGVTFRRMADAPVWHPSVEGWEMLEGGRLVGRFYLDMHPRPGKYGHAAHFRVRTGTTDGALPESALVCNFPGGAAGDPGLMDHGEVETFLHEFGHLMHAQLARQRWNGVSGVRTEWDFVEAPSQMLEEWSWDPKVLAGFARHHETGEPIPPELVRRLQRATEFGRALDVRTQMAYARISLSLYDRPPARVDTDSIVSAVTRAYTAVAPMPGTHMQASFTHLNGYSAFYYTYMWSLVIAKDMFSRFDRSDLMAPGPARRYRQRILERGGSAPAARLVEDFLGRPFRFDAWRSWLETGS
jgi:thimet oligopeptidase